MICKRFKQDHTYFENRECKYFPCHKRIDIDNEGFNCMFCRCPLYWLEICPAIESGDASFLSNGVKDCSNCTYPHRYENREQMSLVYVTNSFV